MTCMWIKHEGRSEHVVANMARPSALGFKLIDIALDFLANHVTEWSSWLSQLGQRGSSRSHSTCLWKRMISHGGDREA